MALLGTSHSFPDSVAVRNSVNVWDVPYKAPKARTIPTWGNAPGKAPTVLCEFETTSAHTYGICAGTLTNWETSSAKNNSNPNSP
jgi:hypothetical protein